MIVIDIEEIRKPERAGIRYFMYTRKIRLSEFIIDV